MILPDLEKELAFWRERLNLGSWQITMRYEADPRDPDTGAPIDGLCKRIPAIPKADILIRAPRTEAEIPNTYDSIIHELLHVRLALMDGSVIAEENAVWPLAGVLTELRMNAPAKAMSLCKALSRKDTLLVAQRRARAGERYKMDPQQLAELAMQAGQLITQEGLGEDVKTLLQQLIALAAGGSAAPAPETEPKEPTTQPGEPQMGMQKPAETPCKTQPTKAAVNALLGKIQVALGGSATEGPGVEALQRQMAEDRAAAVEGVLDTRADLTKEQRAKLRDIGVEKGVGELRSALTILVPAPTPAADQAKVQALPKLGLDKPVRGSARSGFKPSGNQESMLRLRISAEEGEEIQAPGCRLHTAAEIAETGKLMTMSIWDALPAIRKAVDTGVERRKARMGGER